MLVVERHGKTVSFADDLNDKIDVTFKESHKAAKFRNDISLENKKTYQQALSLAHSSNGRVRRVNG